MSKQKHLFEDNERVRIKRTGEVVTIDHWWFYKNCHSNAQYNIKEIEGTWFSEWELEKVDT